MQKIFLFLFISFCIFGNAQNATIEKDFIAHTYHFNLAIEIKSDGEYAEASKIKLINTKSDDVEGVSENLDYITVHDFKRGFVHLFKKINRTGIVEYLYMDSSKKLSSRDGNIVKIKKLADNKYQLSRLNVENNHATQILIINLEDFEYNAANSLHINDVLFLDSKYLKTLRRKEKGRNFIIKNYQTSYDGKKINYKSVQKTEEIDIKLSLPKKLNIFKH